MTPDNDSTSSAGFDNAIGWLVEKWKGHPVVFDLAKQMEVLGRNMSKLRDGKDSETRKKARIVWQKAAQHYWELLWAIVEAKIDAGPPEELTFDPGERLFVDYGHLNSGYTVPNPHFTELLAEPAAVDMYQYERLTDYIRESYALIFAKPYRGPSGGVSAEEKLRRFESELSAANVRRRLALQTLVTKFDLMEKKQFEEILRDLEEGLRDATESDMRTKRVREADNAERAAIREHCKRYETAERTLWYLIDNLEKKLTQKDAPKAPEPVTAAAEPAADAAAPRDPLADFDPFSEIDIEEEAFAPAPLPEPAEPVTEDESAGEADDDSEVTAEEMKLRETQKESGRAEQVDQSLKIVQNVLSLHDRTKFLAGLIVHVTNEAERWRTRCDAAKNKYKGQGIPALKLALREGVHHKRDFMMLGARTARVDTSPLCQNKGKPLSLQRAGEIMMDLTPLDPDMLRASRIRMYGIPRVILVPGQGLGVYDWEDNSLVIPIFDVVSDVKSFCFALAGFRWDNDEDRTLKDTYGLLKQNKGKGIRAMQEAFMNDYFLWLSKERKGYRILPRDVSKWFKTFFKQKTGVANPEKK